MANESRCGAAAKNHHREKDGRRPGIQRIRRVGPKAGGQPEYMKKETVEERRGEMEFRDEAIVEARLVFLMELDN